MRIDAYNQVSQIYKTDNKIKTQKTSKASVKDHVEISSFGKAYQVAKKAVDSASDVREDRVAQIKSQLENGTYEVSGESFAEKMLQKFESLA